MRLWNALSGAIIFVLEGHTSYVNSVSFCHDDTKLISASNNISFWSVQTGTLLKTIESSSSFAVFSSIDDEIIACLTGGKVVLRNAVTGEVTITLEDPDAFRAVHLLHTVMLDQNLLRPQTKRCLCGV